MKKTLSIILSVLMVLSVFSAMPFSALADDHNLADRSSGTCGNGVKWRFENQTLTIYKSGSGTGAMYDYFDGSNGLSSGSEISKFYDKDNIISVVVENGVTHIGNYAFTQDNYLESVSIPSSVESIGEQAFAFSGLTSLNIPDGVKTIDEHAFSDCTDLESVVMADSVESIGYFAFTDCKSLNKIVLSKNIKTISDSAFWGCYALTQVVIPEGVETLEYDAFGYCNNLTTVAIPESLTSIGEKAFNNTAINSVLYASTPEKAAAISVNAAGNGALNSANWLYNSGQCGDNVYYGYSDDGATLMLAGTGATWDYTYDLLADPDCDSPFYENRDIKTIIVGDGITGLGNNLFNSCYDVTSLTLPDGLTSIGERALQYLNSLQSLDLPSTVTSIGEEAFNALQSLKSITIPEGVTSIGKYTFQYCYDLESLVLPKNITVVEQGAFDEAGINDLFVKNGVDLSSARVKSTANVWRYEVLADQTGAPAGKTLVKIVSRDQGSGTTVPCNMNDDRYIVKSAEVSGVTFSHDYDGYTCTLCGDTMPVTTISSYADLKALARQVNAGDDYSGRTVTLADDIECKHDMNDTEYATDWTPIGKDNAHSFKGTFDGNGHTIMGLSTPSDYSSDYVGLFGRTDGAIIENVNVVDADIRGKSCVGGIAGVANNGSVKNCSFSGSVSGSDTVGGIVGAGSSSVENCYNTGTVTGGKSGIGGVVGGGSCKVTNCYNTGSVNCNASSSSPVYIGGVKGNNNAATVSYCYNTGEVNFSTSNAFDKHCVGGVVGINNGESGEAKTEYCYNTGSINASDMGKLGGVVGYNSINARVNNCYNAGNVIGKSGYIGGITGSNDAGCTLENSYSSGATTDTNNGYNCGGVLGGNSGTVKNCCYDLSIYPVRDFNYADSYYGAIPYVNIGGTIENLKAFYTPEMTGTDALTQMGLDSAVWLVKADSVENGIHTIYYPHLKGFNFDSEGEQIAAADINENEWPNKTTVSVIWDDESPFTYSASAQKVTVKDTVIGDFSIPEGKTVKYYRHNGSQYTEITGFPSRPATYGESYCDYCKMDILDGDTVVDTKYFTIITPAQTKQTVMKLENGSYVEKTPIDAGSYKAVASFKVAGHGAVSEKEFAINQKSLTNASITLSADSATYDGNNIDKPTVVSVMDDQNATVPVPGYDVSYTEGNWKDAGTYKVTVTGKGNYTGKAVSAFTINPKAVTITADSASKVYDGTALTENGFTASALESGDTHTFTVAMTAGSTITDYGTQPNVIATVDGVAVTTGSETAMGNYLVTTVNGELAVKKANATVTITGHSNTAVFDGNEHSVSNYDFLSTNTLYTTNDFTFSGTAEARRTDVGKTAMGLDINQFTNKSNNFNVTFNVTDGYQTIVAQALDENTLTVAIDNSTYDGRTKEPAVKVGDVTLTKDTDYTLAYQNSSGNAVDCIKDAGTYTVTVSGKGNYSGEVAKSITVEPAKVTVTVENKQSPQGAWLEVLTYTADGVITGDDLGIALSTQADPDKPGEYAITATASNANYDVTVFDGVYTVVEKPAEPTPEPKPEPTPAPAPAKEAKVTKAEKAEAKTKLNSTAKSQTTSKGVTVYWGKVKNADKYVVYAAYCGKANKYKKIATVKGDKTTYTIKKLKGKKLNQKKCVKAYVVAYRKVDGKYVKLAKSVSLHAAGTKSKYSNVKKITLKKKAFTLKKGKTATIKATVKLENEKKKAIKHEPLLRYTTSNKKVATVTKSGKIKAKGKGTCKIYVISNNGMTKAVKVTVK